MLNIETIAREADVSIATVSRTLRNHQNLKTDNQRRIIDVAKQLGYDFNKRKKRSLSRKTKQIIFLSFSHVLAPESLYEDATYLPIVNGINKVIDIKGYNLIVANVEIDEKPPPALLRNDVDGIIFHGLTSQAFFEKYIRDIPHVGIQHYNPHLKCNCVMTDQWNILFQEVEYLHKIGHRRIAFFADTAESEAVKERYRGYQDALKYLNLPFQKELILCWQRPRIDGLIPAESQLPNYDEQVAKLMRQKNPPTAIICLGDFRALAVSKALEKMGLSIPGDVSIVGAHNEAPRFGFTGCSCNLSDVCSYAAKFILELINNKHLKVMKIMMQPTLSIGTSTKTINH